LLIHYHLCNLTDENQSFTFHLQCFTGQLPALWVVFILLIKFIISQKINVMIQNKLTRIFPLLALVLSLSASEALPREATEKYPYNSVLLNGVAIEFSQLSLVNRGVVSLVRGNPQAMVKTNVPFRVYLQRNGKIIDADTYASHYPMLQYQFADILKFAKAGDEIIIEPADKNDPAARTVIPVSRFQLVPQFNWFFTGNKKGDGC
jgi:hypothetical protein